MVVSSQCKLKRMITHTNAGPDYNCINREMVKFVDSEQTCPCPPACAEKTYPAATSSALWVAEKYKVRLLQTNKHASI